MKRQRLRVYVKQTAQEEGRWGAETETWPDEGSPTTTLDGVILYPLGSNASDETHKPGGANRVITDYTALVPALSPAGERQYVLQSADRVRLDDGTMLQVEGRAHDWASPFSSWEPGYEVALMGAEGAG